MYYYTLNPILYSNALYVYNKWFIIKSTEYRSGAGCLLWERLRQKIQSYILYDLFIRETLTTIESKKLRYQKSLKWHNNSSNNPTISVS